jgi:hypothetical protein
MNIKLDHQAALYSNAPTVGKGGAVKPALTKVCDLMVGFENPSARSVIISAREAENQETVFISRWFDTFPVPSVLVCEGISYRVVRRDPVERRTWWRIYGRATT